MRASSARTSSTGDSARLRKRCPASAMPSQASSMREEALHRLEEGLEVVERNHVAGVLDLLYLQRRLQLADFGDIGVADDSALARHHEQCRHRERREIAVDLL